MKLVSFSRFSCFENGNQHKNIPLLSMKLVYQADKEMHKPSGKNRQKTV